MTSRSAALALGLAAGAAADAVFGDPKRAHPVAAFGGLAQRAEAVAWRDSRAAGTAHTAVLVAAVTAAGAVAERAVRRTPRRRIVLAAAATWAVLGGRTLHREATAVHARLEAHDLAGAREQVTHLVGRDPSRMDEGEVARAVVESVAENTSDAVVAPLLWGAVAGVPGLLGYRAVNTLDAMVGHRSPRYARFGWAAARLDDLANVVPARVTAALVAAVSGRPRAVADVVRRDARNHPSPNAGWCEAAFAGALDVRLGGVNVYGDRAEERAYLGDGKPPEQRDIRRATTLARRVSIAATAVAVAIAGARR